MPLPLPLASSTDTALAAASMVVLVLGYVAVWALWHFVFCHGGDREPPYVVPERDDEEEHDRPPGG